MYLQKEYLVYYSYVKLCPDIRDNNQTQKHIHPSTQVVVIVDTDRMDFSQFMFLQTQWRNISFCQALYFAFAIIMLAIVLIENKNNKN